ncbi:phytanoyl-CoA dioxygenase family protein [Paenibacillus sp.]|uniref:phytanoyl-CoA dioxygenase family protein n=1 Tax=Paenibacillus sp. TaxID=58172 RepID=UPI002D52C171|nr:phytanoyl-CoA dioxygenase family protein [Paenibacillus sp.]HZG88144.1 phytanoyl-CoA dioxygenase family protein [Paenibacillus sp.]
MAATLTPQEIEHYRTQGYVLYHKQLFSEDKLNRLTGIFEEHLEAKGSKLSDELDTPHFRDERLLEFLLSEEALDLVEGVIGPDILLWSSHFICKDPFKGRMTPWHEDSAYWNGRFDRYDNIVTIWLALDRSTKENGCMRVIPGTHVNGFSEYEAVDKTFNTFHAKVKHIEEEKAVYFELERGECSLHDSRIIHGAAANTSPHRRCGYTMRYISADTKVNPEKNPGWRFWLARGRNLAGNPCENA